MAVRRVIKFRPATISDGLYDHRATKAGPFTNSNRKTSVFNPMIRVVIAGKREGLRSMSLSGIIVYLDFSHPSTIFIPLMRVDNKSIGSKFSIVRRVEWRRSGETIVTEPSHQAQRDAYSSSLAIAAITSNYSKR